MVNFKIGAFTNGIINFRLSEKFHVRDLYYMGAFPNYVITMEGEGARKSGVIDDVRFFHDIFLEINKNINLNCILMQNTATKSIKIKYIRYNNIEMTRRYNNIEMTLHYNCLPIKILTPANIQTKNMSHSDLIMGKSSHEFRVFQKLNCKKIIKI